MELDMSYSRQIKVYEHNTSPRGTEYTYIAEEKPSELDLTVYLDKGMSAHRNTSNLTRGL
jgi:hypothetical protein